MPNDGSAVVQCTDVPMSESVQASIASLPWDVQVQLGEDLRKIIPDIHAGPIIQASHDPLPAWVEVVGGILVLREIFGEAVKEYFKRLATHAADATWNKASQVMTGAFRGSANAIRAVYRAVRRASASAERSVGFALAVSLSDEKVTVSLNSIDEDAFEKDFATFIVALDSIRGAVSRLNAGGHTPTFGDFDCKLRVDGFVLCWIEIRESTHMLFNQNFDVYGNPLDEPKRIQ
jgi:hypothetical protein